MKYTIEIDDSTKAGKGLIEITKKLAEMYKSIKISQWDEEPKEDKILGIMIEKSMESGMADTDEVLKKFQLK